MGGGDLNMKKHFHPLTMQNLERVWKAEQKAKEEKERTEQLQQELAEERRREDLQKHAIEKGIIKKKENRLDWMYAGPTVNHEEYLLGKKIDKNIDILKEESESTEPTNVPEPSAGDTTTDLLAKIKEDPLFLIKKKEDENRKELVQNPLKLRKLKEMLKTSIGEDGESAKKKSKKAKKSKHGGKNKKHRRESDSDDDRNAGHSSNAPRRRAGHEEHSNASRKSNGVTHGSKRRHHHEHSRSSSPEVADYHRHKDIRRHKRNDDDRTRTGYKHNPTSRSKSDNGRGHRRENSGSSVEDVSRRKNGRHRSDSDWTDDDKEVKSNGSRHRDHPRNRTSNNVDRSDRTRRRRDTSSDREVSPPPSKVKRKDYTSSRGPRVESDQHRVESNRHHKPSSHRDRTNTSRKHTAEEMEAKREAMLANARWRDEKRGENIKKYKKIDDDDERQAEKEAKAFDKESKAHFIRDIESQTYSSPATTSVEDRIKRNIYSKQRTSAALDKKFTHR